MAKQKRLATGGASADYGEPARPAFFLRTKLLPPRPAPEILARPRLIDRLQSNLALPLTLITANAGSGKTTLVADFLRQQPNPYVWYQLDHTDADASAFLGYLAYGIQQRVPAFGEAVFAYLQQSQELAPQPERAADVLLNEILELVEQPLVIVLDDYHHLGSDTQVHAVLDRLIAYLPEVIHLVIISRETPPLTLARLRSQNAIAFIDRDDLLFTHEETQQLFRKVFGLALTTEQLREYGERTHGWITALQLVRQVAQRQPASGADRKQVDPLAVLRHSERDIFEYFAEEVFAQEPPEVQQFLMKIALLDRVDLETCARLFPEIRAGSVLPALVRGNVFMTVASDGKGEEYRLHPLFQSFLRRRLRSEMGLAGVAAEHARYAGYFAENGAWEAAVRHLIDAEDFERAAEIIARYGDTWIACGKLGSLASLAEALPAAALEKHPRALSLRAEVARLRGDFDTAQNLLRRAIASLREAADQSGEAEALHSLATIARRRGHYESAFEYLDRAIELSPPNSVVRTKCANTRGVCYVTKGQWAAAEREFRAALQSAEEQHDERHARLITHNLGLPAMMRGDFGEALLWLTRMLRSDAESPPIPQEATAHLNIARCHLYRGDLEQSEQHLDLALEGCQLFNMVGQLGEAFEAYGNLYRERGDLARATESYERAERSYADAGIDLARVELMEERALMILKAGDVPRALAQIDRLLERRPAGENPIGHFTASLARGRILLAKQDYQRAAAEFNPALNYFREHGLYYYDALACMGLAVCDHAAAPEAALLDNLRRALDLAARYDYDYWLRQEIAAHPAVFASEDVQELLPNDCRGSAAAIGDAVPVSETAAAVTPAPLVDLTVNLLGSIDIFRDRARPFAADAWTTRRSRDILCFIASRPHRRAAKDAIIDTFWRDVDLKTVERNFHPTMSHVRKALNSNQPLKQNFLGYRDGEYQLNPEFAYSIDTEQFDRLIADGEIARRERDFDRCVALYEQAVALYRGEFMQGSYDDWVEAQRSYYREQYLRILESLAAVAENRRDFARALDLGQRILRDDPFREDIHCLVMRAQAAAGNRVAVKEQYEALRALLQRELGVEPAMPTQKAYKELLGQ
ncbi:MAG TPA: BTAD domain-containing putative transcriptional regulator [Pyrinomonadaceae bacterium]|nr:BTAD domain-containing putative transcriptional regulator [Pyrinomonadaceae bacterium]